MAVVPAFRQEPEGYRFHEIDACTVNSCTGTLQTGLLRERQIDTGPPHVGQGKARRCRDARHGGSYRIGADNSIRHRSHAGMAAGIGRSARSRQRRRRSRGRRGERDRDATQRIASRIAHQHL